MFQRLPSLIHQSPALASPSSALVHREQNKILHPVHSLIAQRVYGLVMGYENINDHETLRHEMIFALAIGKAINSEPKPITEARKKYLSRNTSRRSYVFDLIKLLHTDRLSFSRLEAQPPTLISRKSCERGISPICLPLLYASYVSPDHL
jgi:hypothetical protein